MTDKMPSAKFPPWHTKEVDEKTATQCFEEEYLNLCRTATDMVNSPPHYTKGKFEAIEVIEDAVQYAPNSVYGTLQWQVLKYILRMWSKNNALEDAKKARWYLDRLIDKLENRE